MGGGGTPIEKDLIFTLFFGTTYVEHITDTSYLPVACPSLSFISENTECIKELHNLYSLSDIMAIKSRQMRWAGHAARIVKVRNA